MWRSLFRLIVLAIVFAGVASARYYYFVAFESDPASETGTLLHRLMPHDVKQMSCPRLTARFPNVAFQGCEKGAARNDSATYR